MTEKRNILIVEDEIIISMEIAGILKRLGYGICGQVMSGEEAIIRTGELVPDLILMDIRLQGTIDGIEAADRINELYDIPVLFLTAHSDDTTLQRAIAVQPSGYLIKPFNDRELFSTIELSLYKHDLRKKLRPTALIQTGFDEIPASTPCLFVSRDFIILAVTRAASEMLGTPARSLVSTSLESLIMYPIDRNILYPDEVRIKTTTHENIQVTITIGFISDSKTGSKGYLFFLTRRDEYV